MLRREPCRITLPSPRPFDGQEVHGASGNADDVSRPGSDRWHCPCWLGSRLIVGRSHLYVSFLNYLLHSRGVHCYGSPDLSKGRLLRGFWGQSGPLARIGEAVSGVPVARLPHEKITAFSPPSCLLGPSGVFQGDRVTGRE